MQTYVHLSESGTTQPKFAQSARNHRGKYPTIGGSEANDIAPRATSATLSRLDTEQEFQFPACMESSAVFGAGF